LQKSLLICLSQTFDFEAYQLWRIPNQTLYNSVAQVLIFLIIHCLHSVNPSQNGLKPAPLMMSPAENTKSKTFQF